MRVAVGMRRVGDCHSSVHLHVLDHSDFLLICCQVVRNLLVNIADIRTASLQKRGCVKGARPGVVFEALRVHRHSGKKRFRLLLAQNIRLIGKILGNLRHHLADRRGIRVAVVQRRALYTVRRFNMVVNHHKIARPRNELVRNGIALCLGVHNHQQRMVAHGQGRRRS